MKQYKTMFVGMLVGSLLFTGCKASSTVENKEPVYIKLSQEEAVEMMSEDVIILDVRTQEEYNEGHISNSVLLPDYEIGEKAETVIADKTKSILVYCRSGRRSAIAAKELIALGYEKVYDFGGIIDWTGELVVD